MNFNQIGMTNSIVSWVENGEVGIMSILYSHMYRTKNYHAFYFLRVETTSSKIDVKRLWRPSTQLAMEFVTPN